MDKKIFIIEDDANLLYGLQAKFSILGFDVRVNSGNISIEEVVDSIKKYKPDFVILDLILPKVSGFDILKKFKEDDDLANLLVFVFSNLSDQDSKGKGLDLGAKHYFVKEEFSIDEFVEKVVKIIENKNKLE